MRIVATAFAGLFEVETTQHRDERGRFSRAFCADTFRAAGIDFQPVQSNLSTNTASRTLRGMHFQKLPNAETKLVRVVSGRAFDVVVDLRAGKTFGKWHSVELSAARMNALFIPPGFAHGFLTLEPNTTILYQMSPSYKEGFSAGLRWNDPDVAIAWPAHPQVMSDADKQHPAVTDVQGEVPTT